MSFLDSFRTTARKSTPIIRYGPGVSVRTVNTSPVSPVVPSKLLEPTYTMAMMDGDNAEITMYGVIVESQPVDWWTGEPVDGAFIIQGEFLKDLEAVKGASNITIRMDSVGGDAGVSILIHNRLRELSSKGTRLKCVVDGVAMSGGSLIMCACDEVEVNPSSIIMIHKCWGSLWGGYNADDLREIAASYDAWDKAQISIYKRKCGLTDTVISNMMAKTTYMTGSEAVEKGFADKVLEDANPLNIAASADGRSLFVRGRPFQLMPGMFAPDSIPTVTTEATATVETNNQKPAQTGGQNGGNIMAKTLEELRKEDPALVEQLMAEARAAVSASGVTGTPAVSATPAAPAAPPVTPAVQESGAADPAQAERQRLQDIDALAGVFDAETINAAKYGEHRCTAQEMVYAAAQKASQQGGKFLAALMADTIGSGAQDVGAANGVGSAGAGGTGGEDTPQAMAAQAKLDAKAFNERKKEVR